MEVIDVAGQHPGYYEHKPSAQRERFWLGKVDFGPLLEPAPGARMLDGVTGLGLDLYRYWQEGTW